MNAPNWADLLTAYDGRSITYDGSVNPLRYRGYYYDSESELYYLQTRFYNPELGRFTSPDAYAATGQGILSNNMFAYCNNNPVNARDPCGTCIHWLAFWNDCENCKNKTTEEKIADAVIWGCQKYGKVRDYITNNDPTTTLYGPRCSSHGQDLG